MLRRLDLLLVLVALLRLALHLELRPPPRALLHHLLLPPLLLVPLAPVLRPRLRLGLLGRAQIFCPLGVLPDLLRLLLGDLRRLQLEHEHALDVRLLPLLDLLDHPLLLEQRRRLRGAGLLRELSLRRRLAAGRRRASRAEAPLPYDPLPLLLHRRVRLDPPVLVVMELELLQLLGLAGLPEGLRRKRHELARINASATACLRAARRQLRLRGLA